MASRITGQFKRAAKLGRALVQHEEPRAGAGAVLCFRTLALEDLGAGLQCQRHCVALVGQVQDGCARLLVLDRIAETFQGGVDEQVLDGLGYVSASAPSSDLDLAPCGPFEQARLTGQPCFERQSLSRLAQLMQ